MNINLFKFAARSDATILATNGPLVAVYKMTETGIKFRQDGSNVKGSWEHLPKVSLAAARWHRRNK